MQIIPKMSVDPTFSDPTQYPENIKLLTENPSAVSSRTV